MLSLLSGAVGLMGSVVPSLVKLWTQKSDQAHELNMIKAQGDVQAKIGAARLEETKVQAEAEQMKSIYRHDAQMAKKAAPWTSTLSASVRPVVTYIVVFTWVGLEVVAALAIYNSGAGVVDAIEAAFSEELQSLLSLIIAFWFGNRSLEKMSK
tara:strand:- start:485 stop:943 length:459 start_codon:yes stop_codon:yes gene_type:complete